MNQGGLEGLTWWCFARSRIWKMISFLALDSKPQSRTPHVKAMIVYIA
jgi:hypothetical protein